MKHHFVKSTAMLMAFAVVIFAVKAAMVAAT